MTAVERALLKHREFAVEGRRWKALPPDQLFQLTDGVERAIGRRQFAVGLDHAGQAGWVELLAADLFEGAGERVHLLGRQTEACCGCVTTKARDHAGVATVD